MKKLIILGTGTTLKDIPYNDDSFEIWACGSAFGNYHKDIKRIDLGFEIHTEDIVRKQIEEMGVDYNKFNCEVLVQDVNNEYVKQHIKNIKQFPLDEVVKFGGKKYFVNSFCYMIVYAAMLGYKEIWLEKILLYYGTEYFYELPSIEYWIQILSKREGITFHISSESNVGKEESLYGYEITGNYFRYLNRVKWLWDKQEYYSNVLKKTIADFNYGLGVAALFESHKNKDEKRINEILGKAKENIEKGVQEMDEYTKQVNQYNGALQSSEFFGSIIK